MSRALHLTGVAFIFVAFVLLFLSSISLPFLSALDFVRIKADSTLSSGSSVTNQARFGLWALCEYDIFGKRQCSPTGHGYEATILVAEVDNGTFNVRTATITSAWTRGLAVHPVATALTFIAFIISLSSNASHALFASLGAFLAAFLTLIAFIIDIALLGHVRHEIDNISNNTRTVTAPAFWLTFVSLILLCVAGCTVCFGRRRESGSSSFNLSQMSFRKV